MFSPARVRVRVARLSAIVLAAVLVCLMVGTSVASAGNRVKSTNHCLNPEGTDLNARYDIAEQIAAFFCSRIEQGKPWRVAALWTVSPTFDAAPDGFVPAGDTPLEDFARKLVSVTYVIDPGTRQERVIVFPNNHLLWLGSVDGYPAANTITLGVLGPIRPGRHIIEVHWTFRALHCDGFSDVIDESCLPAGNFLYDRYEIQVTPARRR